MPENDNAFVAIEDMDVEQLASLIAENISKVNRWLGGKTILGSKRFEAIEAIDRIGVASKRIKHMAVDLQRRCDEAAKSVEVTQITETVVTETPANDTEPTVTETTVTIEEDTVVPA